MSAQHETWWEAWLGLLGMSPYEPAAGPDAHGPCVQYPPDERHDADVVCRYPGNTDCDY